MKKVIALLALFSVAVHAQNTFADPRDGKKHRTVKIGDCPAKSIWEMNRIGGGDYGRSNEIPSKCKSITPKVITDYSYDFERDGGFH